MGLRNGSLEMAINWVEYFKDQGIRRVWMAELGNQHLKYDDPNLRSTVEQYLSSEDVTTGKDFFSQIGVEHVSIDLNGRDGALAYDLCGSLPTNLHKRFHIVTNFGTTEHVPSQYNCFRNIHDLASAGSVMIHVASANKNHGGWNYDANFFIALAEANGYEIILPPEIRSYIKPAHVSCTLRKRMNFPFCSVGDFTPPTLVGDFEPYRQLLARRTEVCSH